MPRYKILRRDEESQAERIIADAANEAASLELAIRAPSLFFIREVYRGGTIDFPRHVRGLAEHGRIYVLEALGPGEILEVVAHEVQHCRQIASGIYRSHEQRAQLFAREFSWNFHARDALGLGRELWAFINFKTEERRCKSMADQRQLRRPAADEQRRESDRLRMKYKAALAKRNAMFVGEKAAAKIPAGFELSGAGGDLRICNR